MNYKFLILIFGIIVSCRGYDTKTNSNLITDVRIETKVRNIDSLPKNWNWRSQDKSQEFTIKILKITQDSLYAQYCAVYDYGRKLDCDFYRNVNIKTGFDKNNNLYVGNFFSFFHSGNGLCSIRINEDSLVWKITKAPSGEFYAPNDCTLEKQKNKKIEETKPSSFFPIDYNNLSDRLTFSNYTNDKIKSLFKQKYQIGIDAIAKLPSNGDYDLYIINNVSGDSDLLYLLSISGEELLDGLELANSNGDSENIKVFSINENYEVSIFSEIDNQRKLIDKYVITNRGEFIEK